MQVEVIDRPQNDVAWDEFLTNQSAGHHLQSSAWGQLKAKFGWSVTRVLAWEENQIVGGAQILSRRLPVLGSIGYISKGPVVVPERADVADALLDHINQVAQARRFLILSVQPPAGEPWYMHALEMCQFSPGSFYVVPSTTVLVALKQDEDDILAQMDRGTRYNIRLASRKGVTVQEGDETDLPTFYKLMEMTAARSGYVHYDLAYYQEVWRQFAPRGMVNLLLAYYQGEPLAAIIVIAFGQWAVYKWGASSGAHRDKKPNELLQWTAIRWSKKRGCQYYDMGGIEPASVANALERGEKLDAADSKGAGIACFKKGFGYVVAFPGAYDNHYGILPRRLMRNISGWAVNLSTLRAFVLGGVSVWRQRFRRDKKN